MTSSYKVSVDVGNGELVGEGSTLLSALQSITTPVKIVAKTFLKVTEGKRSVEKVLMPRRARRLFQPHAQVFAARELELLMK